MSNNQATNQWNAVIEADLKDAEGPQSVHIPDGVYDAHVISLEAKTFESKSQGVEVTYAFKLNDQALTIKDYFVVRAATGEVNKTGAASIKKLILECGTPPEKVLTFKYPPFDSKQFGDFKNLLEVPLTIEIRATLQKKGKNAGKSFPRVKRFAARGTLLAKAA